jgi:hypothetical protein
LVCADAIDITVENTNTIMKNTEAQYEATKEVGLEVNKREDEVYGPVSAQE